MLSLPRRSAPFTVCLRSPVSLSELIQLAPLPALQKNLLHVFLFHERGKGRCWLSSESLKHRSGLNSRQTIATHKNALRARGVLSWLQPGQEDNEHRCCLYFLHWDRLVALVADHRKASARPARLARSPRPPRSPVAARKSAPAAARSAASGLPPAAAPQACGPFSSTASRLAEHAACAAPQACEPPAFELPAVAFAAAEFPVFEPAAAVFFAAEPLTAGPLTAEVCGLEGMPEAVGLLAQAVELADLEAFGVETAALPPEVFVASVLPSVALTLPEPPETSTRPEAFEAPALPSEVEALDEPKPLVPSPCEAAEDAAVPLDEPTPTPVSAVRASQPASLRGDTRDAPPSPDFQVPAELVWSCWQDAYSRAYQRPYFPAPSDRFSAASLASSCRSAVVHHAPAGASHELLLSLAEQFLRHVCGAFLRLPGRDGFLQRRGHPLALLLSDLNALGSPWPRRPSVGPSLASAPKTAPPAVVPLPPQQSAARAREALALLGRGPSPSRPSPRR